MNSAVGEELLVEDMGAPDASGERDASRTRWIVFAVSCFLVAIPFVAVQFPPSTDLPQNVAQVRLLFDGAAGGSDLYVTQWLTPYNLGYALIAGVYLLVGPWSAARLSLLLLALSWVGAAHLLAGKRDRSAAAAALATLFVFNHALYWGFFNFLVGWPIFVLWFLLTTSDRVGSVWKRGAMVGVTAVLLFFAHLLWLAAAVVWLLLVTLLLRAPRNVAALRVASLLPALVVASVWYLGFSDPDAGSSVQWVTMPWERLAPEWLARATLGGLRGPFEPIVLAGALAWIGVSLVQNRGRLRFAVDRPLALCAGLFFVLTLAMPFRIETAAFMAERWMPFVPMLALLAVPPPSLGAGRARAVAIAVLAAFCLSTAWLWSAYEETELSGLDAALRALPESPRLLGLDFVRESAIVEGYPFMQTFAYGQVLRGGRVNFTFARFPQSFVRLRENAPPPWTGGLEWHPEWVRAADFDHFGHVLVNGPPTTHEEMIGTGLLVPVTHEGRWRLYTTRAGR